MAGRAVFTHPEITQKRSLGGPAMAKRSSKLPFPGIAKTWDWDCSLAILGLQMPLGSGASYSFNPRIAREVLKSTQRVPQSQDCTKFQDCVGCTILGLRVRNRGCCAHNTRTRKRTQIWQQTRGGWAAVGNTKRRNTEHAGDQRGADGPPWRSCGRWAGKI